ncbi:MAG TPA: hypothetical protein VLS89_12425 [Candidatus Nanopelagicales bacterium]|nr:hypothetical protein [Candidatus Nanopelagicales bacterium]
MSSLALSNKDDYPAAAAKHLDDARALLDAQRLDGAGYLAGYVVECSLRTVIMVGLLAREAEQTAAEQMASNERRENTRANLESELRPGSANMKRFLGKAARDVRALARDHDLDALVDATTGYKEVLTSYVHGYAPAISKGKRPFGIKIKFTDIRYRAEGAVTDGEKWVEEAEVLYNSTVGLMIRDGLIQP